MANVHCKYHPMGALIEDYRAGDQICQECGLVVGDRTIDVSAEWRTFNDDKGISGDRSRVGGVLNPLLDGSDLSTMTVGGETKGQRHSTDPHRTLKIVFREISEMGNKLHLTRTVIDRANILFKTIRDNKKLQGRAIEGVSPACLYIACRQEGVPRTFKEICAVSNASEKKIRRYFTTINNLFKEVMDEVQQVKSGDYMPRFCAMLELSSKVQQLATRISRNATILDLTAGRAPTSITAAAIYMASKEAGVSCDSKAIAEIVGVSESTIKTVYTIFRQRSKELISKK